MRDYKIEQKKDYEKMIVKQMIEIYCKNKHKETQLCPSCKSILLYAQSRIDNCPFIETKGFCRNCTVHCYSKDRQEQIRAIMRYSGPRLIITHPLLTLNHIFSKLK